MFVTRSAVVAESGESLNSTGGVPDLCSGDDWPSLTLLRIERPSKDPQHASAAREGPWLVVQARRRRSPAPLSSLGEAWARSACLHAYRVHTLKADEVSKLGTLLLSSPWPFHSLTGPRVSNALGSTKWPFRPARPRAGLGAYQGHPKMHRGASKAVGQGK